MKHVAIATLLSILFSGIGQLYNGQRIKGIILIIVQLILGLIFLGNVWLMMLYGVIRLGAVVDALVVSLLMVKGTINREFLKGKRAVAEIGIALVVSYGVLLSSAFTGTMLMIWMPGSSEPPEPLSEVRQEAKIYLKDKYGVEFGTEEPRYTAATSTYRVNAYPKTNPDLTFTVFKVGSKPFDDTYVNSSVSKQAREEIQPLIDQLYPDVWIYRCNVGVNNALDDDVVFNGEVMDYTEIRERYPDKYTQHVKISVIRDLDDQGKQEEMKKILTIINYFKEKGIRKVNLSVSIYAESLPEKPRKEKTSLGSYYEHLKYKISLSSNDIAEIETVEDLEEHLRKLN
ncbi:hypothetical protein [Desmospora profundinema]|uniref:TM2 domain-containing membrane protein YozV n=1 Tax=Desmospora profundinema TaxID=1571184 RepID=A0ABU1IPE2_9BACL|nr:hypothetical protein [Desmospora profundinema]MDR6225625.1 TM2 domain-containing membrane protein YozV [Desmospora profundinema]